MFFCSQTYFVLQFQFRFWCWKVCLLDFGIMVMRIWCRVLFWMNILMICSSCVYNWRRSSWTWSHLWSRKSKVSIIDDHSIYFSGNYEAYYVRKKYSNLKSTIGSTIKEFFGDYLPVFWPKFPSLIASWAVPLTRKGQNIGLSTKTIYKQIFWSFQIYATILPKKSSWTISFAKRHWY